MEQNPGPPPTRQQAAKGPPVSTEPTLSDVMASLQSLSGSLNAKFEELKNEVKQLKSSYSELTEEVQGLRDEVLDLRRANDDILNENEELKIRMDTFERNVDDLQGRSRRNNLLFFGMDRTDGETPEQLAGQVQDLLTDTLEMAEDVSFDRIHRLGPGKKSPIIARCTFFKQKISILKAKSKLKDNDSGVSISEDYTQRVRDVRKKLIPHLKSAKEEGKRATLVFDHLLIEGIKYELGEGDYLTEKLRKENK